MKDNYPEEHELQKIKNWPIAKRSDMKALLDYCRSLWMWPNYASTGGGWYRFATGGWSGNESIIGALRTNMVLWTMCWHSSHRGGLYRLKLPDK